MLWHNIKSQADLLVYVKDMRSNYSLSKKEFPMSDQQEVVIGFMRTTRNGVVLTLKKAGETGKNQYVRASRRRQLGFKVAIVWTETREDAEFWYTAQGVCGFAKRNNLRIVNEDILER